MDAIEKVLDQFENYYNPGLAKLNRFLGAVLEYRTEGCYMFDSDGNKYLDFIGGHGVFNFGHRHPKIIEAVKKQLELMPLAAHKVHLHAAIGELSEKLAAITPGDISRAFYCNSGTEAVEGAIKLARASTGKTQIISTENAFHGKSMGSLSVTGRPSYREPFMPLLTDVIHVPFGDSEAIENAINDETAAVILEPIQGEGGVIVPRDGFLKEVRKICSDAGVIFILDEVQTGMGRTGMNFACQYEEVVPDIMTLAKALGGGVMPVGAVLATPKAFEPFEADPFVHTSTFGANPLACAAAAAAIDVLVEEGLAAKAKEKGQYLVSKLNDLKTKFNQLVTDVRGKGLLIGIEFFDEGVAAHIIYQLAHKRIMVLHMLNNPKVIRIEPALIVENEHIDMLMDAIKAALEVY
jgi:putrescine aminotransferase